MNNYPDDIHSYDEDPRSPLYNGPSCPNCGAEDIEENLDGELICQECGEICGRAEDSR